jgi:hypothetical protein
MHGMCVTFPLGLGPVGCPQAARVRQPRKRAARSFVYCGRAPDCATAATTSGNVRRTALLAGSPVHWGRDRALPLRGEQSGAVGDTAATEGARQNAKQSGAVQLGFG